MYPVTTHCNDARPASKSRPIAGSAIPTTVASIEAIAEPSTVAASTQRPAGLSTRKPSIRPPLGPPAPSSRAGSTSPLATSGSLPTPPRPDGETPPTFRGRRHLAQRDGSDAEASGRQESRRSMPVDSAVGVDRSDQAASVIMASLRSHSWRARSASSACLFADPIFRLT